jgi:hypothetical protein
MGLTTETRRVVNAFEYNDADLNSAVREFLDQMGMFLPPPPSRH